MYIEPNTNIKILHNVPLDTTYNHTIYFANTTEQSNYFSGLAKYTLARQSYQRIERGYMRVQLRSENLYDCNYLMFQNSAFGSKWFYAFITSVEYINNEVSEVGFEIDVMQTWFFDVTLKQCYVEREHSSTDKVGDNLVAENFEIGEYFNSGRTTSGLFSSYACILVSPYKRVTTTIGTTTWTSPASLDLPVLPPQIDKQKQGLFYTVLKTENAIATAINELTNDQGKIEDVVCLYPIPSYFVSDYSDYDVLSGTTKTAEITFATETPTSLGSYTPKNKKLLTYPYNKFVIDNGTGLVNEFAYEYFKGDIKFFVRANILQNVAFKCIPYDYMGTTSVPNYSKTTLLTDFPLMAFSHDAFKAWLAQNKTRIAFQTVNSVGSTFSGITSGMANIQTGASRLTPKTGVLSKKGAKQMAKGYEQMYNADVQGVVGLGGIMNDIALHGQAPMETSGTQDGCLEIAMGTKDFNGVQYYLNPTDAKIIDDFFSAYGYATKKFKVPNRNVRPHWTYTKTIDCNLIGNAPADDVAKICGIYNHGITFWRNGSEVGNYSLDNSPS